MLSSQRVRVVLRLPLQGPHCRRCEEDLSERREDFTPAVPFCLSPTRSVYPLLSHSARSLSLCLSPSQCTSLFSFVSLSPFLTLSHFVSRCLKSFPSPHSSLSHSIFCNLPHTVKISLALPLFHPLCLSPSKSQSLK